MAKHKAPTEVTIAAVEEKSSFVTLLERMWIPAAIAAAVIIGMILFRQNAAESVKVAESESWDRLVAASGLSFGNPDWGSEPEKIDASAVGSVAAPWALQAKAIAFARDEEFDQAITTLKQLQSDYPQHELNTSKFAFGDEGLESTLPTRMISLYEGRKQWIADNPLLFDNPELPAGSPTVRLSTDAGDIVVGLYTERAPLHTENFLKLAREGFYDGTRFHRILANRIIQGGDPDSKNDDTLAWGKGGPGYKIDKEETGLFHFEGTLAAAKMGGDEESSGSQFFINLSPQHQWDGNYVVYGKVLEGLEIAKQIGDGEVALNTDRPVEPFKINTATVEGE